MYTFFSIKICYLLRINYLYTHTSLHDTSTHRRSFEVSASGFGFKFVSYKRRLYYFNCFSASIFIIDKNAMVQKSHCSYFVRFYVWKRLSTLVFLLLSIPLMFSLWSPFWHSLRDLACLSFTSFVLLLLV